MNKYEAYSAKVEQVRNDWGQSTVDRCHWRMSREFQAQWFLDSVSTKQTLVSEMTLEEREEMRRPRAFQFCGLPAYIDNLAPEGACDLALYENCVLEPTEAGVFA